MRPVPFAEDPERKAALGDSLIVDLGSFEGPLDVLLQDMASEENAAGGTAAVGGQSRPTRRRSQQIQSNLRECPPANTAKGLACRQEICAVYAGRDPACPAG